MKLYLAILFILVVQSCQIQFIGLTDDYTKLTEEQKALIHPLKNFQNLETGAIYTLNAEQLKKELEKHPRSLVYIFTNGCPSEYCKPLHYYEDFARENEFELFLVMSGFGNLCETLDQQPSNSLFAIDAKYYGTKYRHKYYRYFRNELIGITEKEESEIFSGNLFFFNMTL